MIGEAGRMARSGLALVVQLSMMTILTSSASSQSVADFYRGKQIELIIATEVGTSYDTWARHMARYMPRYIPGNPNIVPKNMPGAGHIRAAGYAFSVAPKDGTSIVTFSHNMPVSYVTGNSAIKFNLPQFQWLGSPYSTGRACVVSSESKVKRASDLFEHEARFAGAGATSAPTQTARLVGRLLEMKIRIIDGYRGIAEALIAVERGEVDGICATMEGIGGARPRWITDGKLVPLFNMERSASPELKVPSIYEFAKTEEQERILAFYGTAEEFGIPLAAPPGVPADRVEALRKAHDAAVKDPELHQYLLRIHKETKPTSAGTLERLMADLLATPAHIVKKANELLAESSK